MALHRIAGDLQSSRRTSTLPMRPAATPPESLLNTAPPQLRLKANWSYGQHGARQHYTIQAWLGKELAGRAHGWFEPGGRFLLEKVEMERRHRSKGYGSAVIEALRAKARECGCTEFVFGGVREANLLAIKLYESMGACARPKSDGLLDFVIAPP